MRYTFYEDRMVFAVVRPSDPLKTYPMRMGTFDDMSEPVYNGQPEGGHQFATYVVDRMFFPHQVYRQGVLITPPPQTPVSWSGEAISFPMMVGQEVSLQFATKAEVDALK
jgi:hypothetical protein